MFQIIIEKNAQIRKMEVEMEKILKENEQSFQLVGVPLTSVPIVGMLTIIGARKEST